VDVGAGADGILKMVFVSEGQTVQRGEKLAEIECSDLEASLSTATAEAESAQHSRIRLLRGSRPEERQVAAQKTVAAKAVLQRASLHLSRMQKLHDNNDVARATLDDAQRDYELAASALREAVRHEELVNAGALPEEVAKIDAEIAAAEHRIRVIQEKLGKCVVTAPASGTILRVLLRPGESFSTMVPRPLLSMADISVLRVRAEVDESDVLKVRVGQKALVFSETRQDLQFPGTVKRISGIMGQKRFLSHDPAEKADHDVLDTIVELDRPTPKLPLGLRVLVQFLQ
jgi:multidrug resistance efflux pump